MPDFFISRAGEDAAWGLWIAQTLHDDGYSVRLQDWHFTVSNDFVDLMGREIASCRKTIALFSPWYFVNEYSRLEHNTAITYRDRRLLPVKIAPCRNDTVSRSTIYVDLAGVEDEAMAKDRLLREIRKECGAPIEPSEGAVRERVRFPVVAKTFAGEHYDTIVHLCDREPQEKMLRDDLCAVMQKERPTVCVLFGDEDHLGHEFVKRMPASPLPVCLGVDRDTIPDKPEVFVWPAIDKNTTAESFRNELQMEAQRVLNDLSAAGPALVYTDFLTDTWCCDIERATNILKEFLQFCGSFRVEPPRPFIVCLVIHFRKIPSGWLRGKRERVQRQNIVDIMEALQKNPPDYVRCLVLPPLEEVDRGRARAWTMLGEVKRVKRIGYDAIDAIYEHHAAEKLTMKSLAPELKKLLHQET